VTDREQPRWMDRGSVRVPDHVVFRPFEEETLVLNLETGQYHSLNATGGRMLELLQESDGRLREIADRLAAEYRKSPEEVAADLEAFCAELADRGLIEADGDAA
jgi:PqqD family protein of HPr-rel-A system